MASRFAEGTLVRRVTVRPGGRRPRADGATCRAPRRQPGPEGTRARPPELWRPAGFSRIERNVTFSDLGIGVDFRAQDATGGLWLFDFSGAYSTTRPGLRRPEVLWRALGKASVLHEARKRHASRDDLGPLVLFPPMPLARGPRAARSSAPSRATIGAAPSMTSSNCSTPSAWSGCVRTGRVIGTRDDPRSGRRPTCPMTGPRPPSSGPHSGPFPSPILHRPWRVARISCTWPTASGTASTPSSVRPAHDGIGHVVRQWPGPAGCA